VDKLKFAVVMAAFVHGQSNVDDSVRVFSEEYSSN